MNKPAVFTTNEIKSLQGSFQAFNTPARIRYQGSEPVAIEVLSDEESCTISKVTGKTGIPYYQMLSDDRQIVSSNKRKFIAAVLNQIIN